MLLTQRKMVVQFSKASKNTKDFSTLLRYCIYTYLFSKILLIQIEQKLITCNVSQFKQRDKKKDVSKVCICHCYQTTLPAESSTSTLEYNDQMLDKKCKNASKHYTPVSYFLYSKFSSEISKLILIIRS